MQSIYCFGRSASRPEKCSTSKKHGAAVESVKRQRPGFWTNIHLPEKNHHAMPFSAVTHCPSLEISRRQHAALMCSGLCSLLGLSSPFDEQHLLGIILSSTFLYQAYKRLVRSPCYHCSLLSALEFCVTGILR